MKKNSRSRRFIFKMIRKMQNGIFIGECTFIIGLTFWKSISMWAGIPLLILSGIFLSFSIKHVVLARLKIRRLEKSGEAWIIYDQIERPSCIYSPQTNTIITDDYIISRGGKKGFEIIRFSDIKEYNVYDYTNNQGHTREIRIILKDESLHYVAFINQKNPIPESYQEVVDLIEKGVNKVKEIESK